MKRHQQNFEWKLASVLFPLLLIFFSSASAQTLRIYSIDVEQGDATLFVAPGGKTLLVDSGKNGHGRRIKAVMDQAGVSRIDYFVNTHYHEDHYGGIDDLVQLGTPVLESYDRGDKDFLPASKRNEATFKDYQKAVGEDAHPLRRGMTIPLDPLMAVTCVASGGVVLGEENPTTGIDENDMSVSLLITFGAFRYFVGGDIEQHTEAKIAARDLVQDVDVYQANHHGSDTSSSIDFMEDLVPSVVIISNGDNGIYKHPRQATLSLYSGLPSPPTVFQTNKYFEGPPGGNVSDNFIADPESTDEDGTILVSIDAAAGTYMVSYGAASSHSFPTKAVPTASIVIESVLPNPVGSDEEFEEVTLKNIGTEVISLSGWTLKDRSGLTWMLDSLGTLRPEESKLIRREGMSMSLNNAGDEITLSDPSHVVRDSFAYIGSEEGVRIQTGH